MSKDTILASVASLKVLEGWGVDTIYGIPSGTLNSLMDALASDEHQIEFIQVKHEEVGAMAAVMQRKYNGNLGVCIGSGGPGASHLINGLYDAQMDGIPVVAILGARPQKELNMDAFQEMDQFSMYDHLAVYNHRVAYPEQLPKLVDEAARHAIAYKGVAVLEVPADFGFTEIDASKYYSSGPSYQQPAPPRLDESKIDQMAEMLNQAESPIIYAGIGTMGHGDAVQALSRKIKAPVITTGKNFETFEWDFEGLLGSTYRVGWKPANEAILEADTVLFIGSNFPFAEIEGTFRNVKNFIQIDINPAMIGKRHETDIALVADAGEALASLLDKVKQQEDSAWWQANIENAANWREYMQKLETKESGPLQFYQVYDAINRYAAEDAIYAIDVGNATQTSIRHLHMTPKNMWRTSPLFATMGIGLPGALGAKRAHPDRQVWNLAGDGAFSMVYPDIVTHVRYNLPTINVVFSNQEYAFIKNKYEDTNETTFGTDITIPVDFAKIAEAQGALGLTVERIEDIHQVMEQAVQANNEGQTVVIDCKITNDRPIPVENLILDPQLHSEDDINVYKERYEAENLMPLRYYLEQAGLSSQYIK